MERTGSTSPGVSAPALAEVAGREGPFLSLYLTTEKDVDHAAQTSVRRWGPVRRRLADDGAPERCLSAVDGLVPDAHLEGTLASLREARVDVLVVHDPAIAAGRPERDGRDGAADGTAAPGDGEAWFDPGAPAMCAVTPAGLRALGVADPRPGRLVDVAVRAALVSGATVRVVPAYGGPEGGLGALLRWAE